LLYLQVWILFVGERHIGSILHLLLVFLQNFLVDLHFRGSKRGRCDEFEGLVANEFASKPARLHVSDENSMWRQGNAYRKGFSKL
jgi:hypothetical protein